MFSAMEAAEIITLVMCCHTVIHIIFLKPLYVPNILPQISVVSGNWDIYLLRIKGGGGGKWFVMLSFLRKAEERFTGSK